jgi:molybdopterin synthase catalytic subunit
MRALSERILTGVTRTRIDERELAAFVAAREAGAVVVFSGVVRNHHEGRKVLRVEYVGVEQLAAAKLGEIAADTLDDQDVHRVAAVHRLGMLEVGEASVVVCASASHRDSAFRAARRLIDRIKELLPVWKHEHFEDGTAAWAPGFAIVERESSALPARAHGGGRA